MCYNIHQSRIPDQNSVVLNKLKQKEFMMNAKRMIKKVMLLVVSVLSFSVMAKQIKLDLAMANPVLSANKKHLTYLKVGLTGFELNKLADRTAVNIALVIDKSGSMSGEKIEKAKEAAIMAVNRLGKDDIVSIITYDSTVNVLVPATKLTDKELVIQKIRTLEAGGSTALFAGVSKGATEINKFFEKNKVNRIILLSDGQANVGPNSPGELGELGLALGKKGISVTTIGLGLGYNEDLMVALAGKSDGNHAFVKDATNLVKIFNLEFNDVLSVIAQEIVVKIKCNNGIRPVKILGRDAEINGQNVITLLNQLYSQQEKYVLLEVEIPPNQVNSIANIATVELSYANMLTGTNDELNSKVSVRFSESEKLVEESVDREVMIEAVSQVAILNTEKAIRLRDEGKVKEAKKVLGGNVLYLLKNSMKYKSKKLEKAKKSNELNENNISNDSDWNRNRKGMKKRSHSTQNQQEY